MEVVQELVQQAFAVDSFSSILLRGAIWVVIALVILISTDHHDPESSMHNLKANLGFFLIFLTLSGGLIYMLFGFNAQA